MRYKILILLALLGAGLLRVMGQNTQFFIQADAGVGAGWWYYLHQQDDLLGERMDRSHLDASISTAVRLRLQRERVSVGLAYQLRSLRDDELVAYDDRVGNRHRIPLAPNGGSVERHCVGLNLGYLLVQKPAYRVGFEVELGTFSLNSLHPDQDNFGFKMYRQFHLTQHFRLAPRFFFIGQMQFSRSHVWMINPAFPGEKHNFISVGINGGFEWAITIPRSE
jgi:hypothetical protein